MRHALTRLTTAVLAGVVTLPILFSPYAGDDTQWVMLPARRRHEGWSLFEQLVDRGIEVPARLGRFLPLDGFLYVGLFHVFTTRTAYKTVQWLGVLAAAAAVAYAAGAIGRSRFAGVVAGIAFAASLQMRAFYDGAWQFFLQQPLIVVLVAVLVVALWRAEPDRRLSWAGLAAWTALLLLSTFGLFLLPLVVAALWMRRALRAAVPYLAAWGAAVVVNVVLRLTAEDPYATALAPRAVARTFWYQFAAAVPGSYRWLGDPPDAAALDLSAPPAVLVAATAVVAGALIAWAFTRLRPPPTETLVPLAVTGALVWVIPCIGIAVSEQYQLEVRPGLDYIVVFLEYMGVALLLTAAIGALAHALRNGIAKLAGGAVLGLATAAAVAATMPVNWAVVDLYSGNRVQLEAVHEAVERGFVDHLDEPVFAAMEGLDWLRPAYLADLGAPLMRQTKQADEARTVLTSTYLPLERTAVIAHGDVAALADDGTALSTACEFFVETRRPEAVDGRLLVAHRTGQWAAVDVFERLDADTWRARATSPTPDLACKRLTVRSDP